MTGAATRARNHPPILALGYSEAAMLLRGPSGERIGAILSIHGRHEFAVEAPTVPRRLDLHFDDEDVPDPADVVSVYRCLARQKWAAANGRPLTPPTPEDARAILDFARSVEDVKGVVLVQCHGGVSRSPAAALLCLAAWTGEGAERACVQELLRVRPCAAPHAGLVAFGDALLGRGGKLVQAIREVR